MATEKGHNALIGDIKKLLEEVENGDFGGFSDSKYKCPKTALSNRFYKLRNSITEGKYN